MRKPTDPFRASLFWMLALYGATAMGDAIPLSDPFDEGVNLTREGRFQEALPLFLAAQRAGDDSGLLQFNLGVVYYRLQRFEEARAAFDRASADALTADLSHYNLGLVALAEGRDEEAVRWFRRTAEEARQPDLRALARAALDRSLGAREGTRGSIAALRGTDSNVVIPIGAISDAPSSIKDRFWELRIGWADRLDSVLDGLGYRFNGLLVEYDDVQGANLGLTQVGVDWRGPITLEANAGALMVDDSGYQRSLELRMLATPYATDDFAATVELGAVRLDSLDARAQDAEGGQHSAGLSFDGRVSRLGWNLNGRRIFNDRESAALSPVQDAFGLRLRFSFDDWSARAFARYVDSDYRTERRDEFTEFGLGLSWSFATRWDVFVEGAKQRNRSTVDSITFSSDRLTGGLRLRF
ncbi:MAG: tetratricopeptide repeat protein [Panacagrimonas sp.]